LDRVFLDANVLYAAAYKLSSPLRRLWGLKDVELWSCDYAVAEALGNLRQDRPEQVGELERLAGALKLQAAGPMAARLPGEVELVAKDRPILLSAIGAEATHLLTGDKRHFGPCFGHTMGGVLILPPSEYLRLRH
jgi:hypothetical protein